MGDVKQLSLGMELNMYSKVLRTNGSEISLRNPTIAAPPCKTDFAITPAWANHFIRDEI